MTTLLITGVTGFLGGAALEKILHQETRLDLLLLVRADSPEAGLERVKENMRKFNIAEEKLAMLRQQHILLGDLASPEHFLNDPRLDQVTHILNCAAVASFGSNPLIWKVNVEGTLRLAQRMAQVTGLQRFLHVGTAMSCSPEPDSLVAESAEFRERAEHPWNIPTEVDHRAADAAAVPYATAGNCPPLYRGGSYPSRLPAFQQYFLGVQHGADAAEIHVLHGGPN